MIGALQDKDIGEGEGVRGENDREGEGDSRVKNRGKLFIRDIHTCWNSGGATCTGCRNRRFCLPIG